MQTTFLSASTYFSPMTTRGQQTVDTTESYRDTRHDWDTAESSTDNCRSATRKIPTESDDREEYSSDSERAEDDVDGASDWNSGSTRRLSEEDGGGFKIETLTARPVLTATLSLGDPVVHVAAEPASADTSAAQFSFPNDVDENRKAEEEDGGVKEIEDGLKSVNLEEPVREPRGPNGGRATSKPGDVSNNSSPGSDGSFDSQPNKFYKPNVVESTSVQNAHGGYDFYPAQQTPYISTLRMQHNAQRPFYDLPTGQCFPTQFIQAPDHYFETPHQVHAPSHPSQVPATMYDSGFTSACSNQFSVGSYQQEFPGAAVYQGSLLSPSRFGFFPEKFSTTLNQHQSSDFGYSDIHQDTFPGRLPANGPPCAAVPCCTIPTFQQYPGQNQGSISNVRRMPPVSVNENLNLMHDTYTVAAGNTGALSAEPVIVQTTSLPSELEDILAWVDEQPETHLLEKNRPPMIEYHPEFVDLNATAHFSDNLPLSSPGYCLPQCQELTPTTTTTMLTTCSYPNAHTPCSTQIPNSSSGLIATSYFSKGNSRASPTRFPPNASISQTVPLPGTVSPPSGTLPYSNPASVMAVSMSPSTPSGCDPADDTGSHSYSPRSDSQGMMMVTSDQGSVASSPSSASEDGVTILIGDEAQVAEAEAMADSIPELDLISQDSQGDTPLHVAILDDQLYLAEALLRRLIRRDLLRQIINVRNKLQQTPLCLAVICNKPQIVETLIENGADVNVHLKASDDYLGTKFSQPLHLASSRGHLWKQTLKKLLRSRNIELDAFNSDGKSALHCAIEGHGKPFKDATIDCKDTLRMLAERGANLNQPDCGHEKTPLHYAIERRDVELVSRLLVLARQFTPDHELCSVAKMLEARTGNGNTALHLAASVDMDTAEHKKLIQQLMSKGADPSSKNSDGFLPRELTKNRAIVELLKGRTASGR